MAVDGLMLVKSKKNGESPRYLVVVCVEYYGIILCHGD